MKSGRADWSVLPEDVSRKIVVHVLLQWKVPWHQIDLTVVTNVRDIVVTREHARNMRKLNRVFFSVLRPIAQVYGVPDRPYFVDRFVEGVLRIYGHRVMEGYKHMSGELGCHLKRTFHEEVNARPFPPHVARHYYSCIAGTMLRLLRDGTIRVPTHVAVCDLTADIQNVFMPLFYKPNQSYQHTTNLTWIFSANLPSPGAVVYSLLCPNTWLESYEMYRDHPGSVIV